MAFKVGTGVVHTKKYGTGTVLESKSYDDRTNVRFDKDDAERTILNQYLQPSQHKIKVRERVLPVIEPTLADLSLLDQLTLKRRGDCWASFSVNEKFEIWIFITRSWTPKEKRKYIRGECPVVERIAKVLLSVRREGGRVLLTSEGAKYITNAPEPTRYQHEEVLFAQFKLPMDWETEGPESFRPPKRAIYAPCEVEPPPLPPHDPSPASD